MSANTTAPITADAGHPFNDPSADLVLRSSDGVDFHVHRAILAIASPAFKDMFSIDAASSSSGGLRSTDDEMKDSVPVCTNFSEDGAALRTLLSFCYPLEDLVTPTLDDIIITLSAALKYQMEGSNAMVVLKKRLLSPAHDDPFRVYAFAVSHGLEEEARIAAQMTLRCDIFDLAKKSPIKLQSAPSHTFQRLAEFFGRCRTMCTELCTGPDYSWMGTWDPMYTFRLLSQPRQSWEIYDLPSCGCGRPSRPVTFGSHSVDAPPAWWHDFIEKAKAELLLRPAGEVITSRELLNDTHHNQPSPSRGCSSCRVSPGTYENMQSFARFFAEKIDRRTREISQQMTFC